MSGIHITHNTSQSGASLDTHHQQKESDMKDITTTMTEADEASAVVDDDGASIIAGSQVGRAFSGHTDQRYAEAVQDAKAVVAQYCVIGDDGGLGSPRFVKNGQLEFLLAHVTKWHGYPTELDALERLVDEVFVSFQTKRWLSKHGLVGSVSLDLDPSGQWPQDRGHPTAPKVVFLAVDKNTIGTEPLYDAEKRRYMAVWFTPNVDEDGSPLDYDGQPLRPRGNAHRLYCDDRYLAGYKGIVAWYPSLTAAKAAHRELLDAVRTIGKPPPSADEDDPMREELLQQYIDEDRAAGRRSRRRPPVERVDPFGS